MEKTDIVSDANISNVIMYDLYDIQSQSSSCPTLPNIQASTENNTGITLNLDRVEN